MSKIPFYKIICVKPLHFHVRCAKKLNFLKRKAKEKNKSYFLLPKHQWDLVLNPRSFWYLYFCLCVSHNGNHTNYPIPQLPSTPIFSELLLFLKHTPIIRFFQENSDFSSFEKYSFPSFTNLHNVYRRANFFFFFYNIFTS